MKIHLQKNFKCSDMQILMVGSIPCGVYLLVGTFKLSSINILIIFSKRSHCIWSSESIWLSTDYYYWKYWCINLYGIIHTFTQCLGHDDYLWNIWWDFFRYGLSSVCKIMLDKTNLMEFSLGLDQ
jgi:hypothetical protein